MTGHRPRKRLGQHFLRSRRHVERMIEAIKPAAGDRVVEIGPGEGALTWPLLECLDELHAVEFDRDLLAHLAAHNPGNLVLHEADALDFDFGALASDGRPLRIAGNLPYNISTPLIFHLLKYSAGIRDMHFMLQKEVVERIAAEPGSKVYGRLSVMTQYHCDVRALFNVPPAAFHPPPKVDSAVVRMCPRPFPTVAQDPAVLSGLVRDAFGQRRKTLRNALSGWLDADEIAAAGVDPGARAETLTVEQFVALANRASARRSAEP